MVVHSEYDYWVIRAIFLACILSRTYTALSFDPFICSFFGLFICSLLGGINTQKSNRGQVRNKVQVKSVVGNNNWTPD